MTFSFSATIDELNSSVTDLSSQISALNKEIESYNKQIENTQGEAKSLKNALATLETRKKSLLRQIDKIKLQIKEAEGNIVLTAGQISDTEKKIKDNTMSLNEIIRNMDISERNSSNFLNIFTNTRSLSEVFDLIKKEEDITLAVNNYVIDLQSNKNDLSVVKSNYEDKKQSLVTLNKSLSNQTLLVDQATIEKNQLLVETKNKESNYQKLLEDRQSQRDALEAELNDIESKLLFVADLNKLPKPGEGVLAYPLEKIRITQYFGNTTFAKRTGSYAGKGHNGIDFAASVGPADFVAFAVD